MSRPPASDNEKPAAKPNAFKRFAPLAIIIAIAVAIFASGAHRYLSLEALSENYDIMKAFVSEQFVLAIFLFIVAYIVVTATSIPGAAFLSLGAGLMFGTIMGVGAVLAGATIGATIVFVVARSALGDALRSRAGGFTQKLEAGFRDNAFSYLLLLRLIPAFPFFVVNIAPALFGVNLRTYVLATFIGIIPGVFAYVSAGNGLGAVIASGGDVNLTGLLTQPAVLTPIIAMSLLALIPVIYKQLKKNPDQTESSK